MQYEDETGDSLLVTGFLIGTAAFGVDARLVSEVVKVGEITRVYDAPPGVVGIRNLRGRIVTVVDMAVHLDLGGQETGSDSRLLIMEHQGEIYGFLVNSVTDAVALAEDDIEVIPVSLPPALKKRLLGVFREEDRIIAILDSTALFQWEESA